MTVNGQLPSDPVEAALEAIRRFDSVFREECSDTGEAIARRLKDFPQIALQAGLVPALTFLLSKLDSDEKHSAYKAVISVVLGKASTFSVVSGEQEARNRRSVDSVCGTARGEGGGYPHALALLLAYAGLQAGCNIESLQEVGSKLVECIERIKGEGVVVERLVLSYANELKKLTSALYPSRES